MPPLLKRCLSLPPNSWNTCKQKQQLAKARAGELGGSPEGEKLHSDSGVFLDTHSLQEHHQLNKGKGFPPRSAAQRPGLGPRGAWCCDGGTLGAD